MQFTSKTSILFLVFVIFSTIASSVPVSDGVKNDYLLERSDPPELSKRDARVVGDEITKRWESDYMENDDDEIDRRDLKRLSETGIEHSSIKNITTNFKRYERRAELIGQWFPGNLKIDLIGTHTNAGSCGRISNENPHLNLHIYVKDNSPRGTYTELYNFHIFKYKTPTKDFCLY